MISIIGIGFTAAGFVAALKRKARLTVGLSAIGIVLIWVGYAAGS